jgi:hypothetical protein
MKFVYNIIDFLLCAPLVYIVAYEVAFKYLWKYKMIGPAGVVMTSLNALTSIMGNQREFLSILALNRVRRYYVASTAD